MNKDKTCMISSIDDILFLSDFICYNKLGINKKKIQKKLKKLKKEIENDEYELCMNDEWRKKHNV